MSSLNNHPKAKKFWWKMTTNCNIDGRSNNRKPIALLKNWHGGKVLPVNFLTQSSADTTTSNVCRITVG